MSSIKDKLIEKIFEPVSQREGMDGEYSDCESSEEDDEEEVDDVLSENVDFGKCKVKAKAIQTQYRYALS